MARLGVKQADADTAFIKYHPDHALAAKLVLRKKPGSDMRIPSCSFVVQTSLWQSTHKEDPGSGHFRAAGSDSKDAGHCQALRTKAR